MPTFSIDTDSHFGTAYSGDVTINGTGEVKLTDKEVQLLINLIRENGGETDVEELQLQEKYPDIYSILDDAYRKLASQIAFIRWINEEYDNGWYELSDEEIAENCNAFGFEFDYDSDEFLDKDGNLDDDTFEKALSDALSKWIKEYRSKLNDYDDALFLAEVFHLETDNYYDHFVIDYSVKIPDEIIAMANRS